MQDYEIILQEFNSTDETIYLKAKAKLKEIGNSSNIEPIVAAIKTLGADLFPVCEHIIGKLADKSVAQLLFIQVEDNLIYLLQNSTGYDCFLAARILAKRKVTRAIPFIGALLLIENLPGKFGYNYDFHNAFIKDICHSLLKFTAAETIDYFIQGLKESEAHWNILCAMETLNDIDVTSFLIQAHLNAEPSLQSGIVKALANLGNHRAIPLLLEYLSDSNIRTEIIEGLGRIMDPRAVDPLLEILPEIPLHELSYMITTLVSLGDPKAVVPLLDLLKSYLEKADPDDKEDFLWIFHYVIKALGKLADKRAFCPLIQAALQRKNLLLPVLEALSSIDDKETIASLLLALDKNNPLPEAIDKKPTTTNTVPDEYAIIVDWLQSRDVTIRSQTAKTLYRIISTDDTTLVAEKYRDMQKRSLEILHNITEDQTSAEYLILTLNDYDKAERLYAIKKILSIKDLDPRVVAPLQRALTDENKIVRAYADKALRTIR